MRVARLFTAHKTSPYDGLEFEQRQSELKNPDGSGASAALEVTVPKSWSNVASDIMAQKYFRRRGVPEQGAEKDARQVFHRLAGCWRYWGEKHGYFDSTESAAAFYDEACFMLAHQYGAPNSPQWFNTGLHFAYGLEGPPQGHYYVTQSGEIVASDNAYERPQPHACFIQAVRDNLVSEGGIMDLWAKEARLFKYGSGTGTNFSSLRGRGEPLSGGGVSSGLMSFLRVGDRAAGAIKSGGTTRRAAKMVCLDIDHPDVEDFVNWKLHEEQKVAALVAGAQALKQHLERVLVACQQGGKVSAESCDASRNKVLGKACRAAQQAHVPPNYIARVLELARQGHTQIDVQSFDTDWNSEAYQTVAGQNSNNSVRIKNAFMQVLAEKQDWALTARSDGSVVRRVSATQLWNDICFAAWSCADPGLQFDDTINEWHTCPQDGRIRASNPCSEYMFLDDTACNLASLNLLKFYDYARGTFNVEAFRHACRLWTVVLDISVQMAQFPSREIARQSWNYRTLGLGYANIGALLMTMGIPYGSERATAIGAALTALMTAEAYRTSAELAQQLAPFPRFAANRADMLRVIGNHRAATHAELPFDKLSCQPQRIAAEHCPPYLLAAAQQCWDEALALGTQYGYRNAQTTVIAPTGTIGLLMDCDTTGIEPDYALVKYKKLAGGGYFKIINQSVPRALQPLGYRPQQIKEIVTYCVGHGTLAEAPHINFASLKEKGFTDDMLVTLNAKMPHIFDISFAFTKWTLGERFCVETLKIERALLDDPTCNILPHIGFSAAEIAAANEYVCGTMTLEGAPHLREEHLAVFDCANKCGRQGKRYISPSKHLAMLAAAQPHVSGAISKTINLPYEATLADIDRVYRQAWASMIKAIALYRDGSKLSQPLATQQSEWYEEGVDVRGVGEDLVRFHKGTRRHLPNKRSGYTQKVKIEGHNIYLRTGEYENGDLGEIFLDMNKEGTLLGGIMNSFAIAVSLGLQYGVPLDEFVDVFTFSRFEPSGLVLGHNNIKHSTSIIDFLFRDLAINYLDRGDLSNTPHKERLLKSETQLALAAPLEQARASGYAGEPCPSCNSLTLVRNGSCLKCLSCGETTGCS